MRKGKSITVEVNDACLIVAGDLLVTNKGLRFQVSKVYYEKGEIDMKYLGGGTSDAGLQKGAVVRVGIEGMRKGTTLGIEGNIYEEKPKKKKPRKT